MEVSTKKKASKVLCSAKLSIGSHAARIGVAFRYETGRHRYQAPCEGHRTRLVNTLGLLLSHDAITLINRLGRQDCEHAMLEMRAE